MVVRTLVSREDIDFAVGLTVKEGWNYTAREIELMLELDPQGSFIYEEGREPLGFVTTVTYSRTGVIGHLIVDEKARRRRIGDALVKEAIEYMEGRGADSMILYATTEGSKLYERFRFTPRDEVLCVHLNLEMQRSKVISAGCTPVTSRDLEEIISVDKELFGDDRRRLLTKVFERSSRSAFKIDRGNGIEGYIFARPDHIGYDLGPWACLSGRHDDAENLFGAVLSAIGEGIIYTGTFAKNRVAERIFRTLPVARSWIIPIMIRGKNRYESAGERVFAIAAFELG